MRPKKGFTLIELLVVIAIIALLMSVVIPALSKAKDVAKRIIDLNNLKQIGLCLGNYAQSYNQQIMPSYRISDAKIADSSFRPEPFNSYMVYHPNQTRADGSYRPFHLAILYDLNYVATAETFYCPAQPRTTRDYAIPYYHDFYVGKGDTSDYFNPAHIGNYRWGTVTPADRRGESSRLVRTSYNYWNYGQSKMERIGGYKPLVFDNIQDWRVVPHRKGRNLRTDPQGLSAVFADGHANFCTDRAIFDDTGGTPWNKVNSLAADPMTVGQGPGNTMAYFEEVLRRMQGN